MNSERGPKPHPDLPEALAAFLREQEYASLTQETQWGTTLILKAPRAELLALAGPVPVQVHHALYHLPTAPVIRMLTTLIDHRTGPTPEAVSFETFFNVADTQQRREYGLLATQEDLPILGYDEALARALAKRVPIRNGPEIAAILSRADAIRAGIPAARYDFDQAKAIVVARTLLHSAE